MTLMIPWCFMLHHQIESSEPQLYFVFCVIWYSLACKVKMVHMVNIILAQPAHWHWRCQHTHINIYLEALLYVRTASHSQHTLLLQSVLVWMNTTKGITESVFSKALNCATWKVSLQINQSLRHMWKNVAHGILFPSLRPSSYYCSHSYDDRYLDTV